MNTNFPPLPTPLLTRVTLPSGMTSVPFARSSIAAHIVDGARCTETFRARLSVFAQGTNLAGPLRFSTSVASPQHIADVATPTAKRILESGIQTKEHLASFTQAQFGLLMETHYTQLAQKAVSLAIRAHVVNNAPRLLDTNDRDRAQLINKLTTPIRLGLTEAFRLEFNPGSSAFQTKLDALANELAVHGVHSLIEALEFRKNEKTASLFDELRTLQSNGFQRHALTTLIKKPGGIEERAMKRLELHGAETFRQLNQALLAFDISALNQASFSSADFADASNDDIQNLGDTSKDVFLSETQVRALLLAPQGLRTISSMGTLTPDELFAIPGIDSFAAVQKITRVLALHNVQLKKPDDNSLQRLPLDWLEAAATLSKPAQRKKTFRQQVEAFWKAYHAYINERPTTTIGEAPPAFTPFNLSPHKAETPAQIKADELKTLAASLDELDAVLAYFSRHFDKGSAENPQGYDRPLEELQRERAMLQKHIVAALNAGFKTKERLLRTLARLGIRDLTTLTSLSFSEIANAKNDIAALLRERGIDDTQLHRLNFLSSSELGLLTQALASLELSLSNHYHTLVRPEDLIIADAAARHVVYHMAEGASLVIAPPPVEDRSAYIDLVPVTKDGSPLKKLPTEVAAWLTGSTGNPVTSFERLHIALTMLPDNTELAVRFDAQTLELTPSGNENDRIELLELLQKICSQNFITLAQSERIRDLFQEGYEFGENGDKIFFTLLDVIPDRTTPTPIPQAYQRVYAETKLAEYGIERFVHPGFNTAHFQSMLVDPRTSPYLFLFLPGCSGAWSSGGSGVPILRTLARKGVFGVSIDPPHHVLGDRGSATSSMTSFTHSLATYIAYLKAQYPNDDGSEKPLIVMGRSFGAVVVDELDYRYPRLLAGKIGLSGFKPDWIRYNVRDLARLSTIAENRYDPRGLMWALRKSVAGQLLHFNDYHDLSRPYTGRPSPTTYIVGDSDTSYPEGSERFWENLA